MVARTHGRQNSWSSELMVARTHGRQNSWSPEAHGRQQEPVHSIGITSASPNQKISLPPIDYKPPIWKNIYENNKCNIELYLETY